MIYINKRVNLPLELDNTFVVFDFDRTMTKQNSEISWSIIEHSPLMPNIYKNKSANLYNYYRKIELDKTISGKKKKYFMEKWFFEQLKLLSKYCENEKIFHELTTCVDQIYFRDGLKNFLKQLEQLNIPVIIISAGLGNIVQSSLVQNDCFLSNVKLISNILKYENNEVKLDSHLVSSTSKNDITVPFEIIKHINQRQNIILFGDQISDLFVIDNFQTEEKISIGFLTDETLKYINDYKKAFDIICTKEVDYKPLNKLLIKKGK